MFPSYYLTYLIILILNAFVIKYLSKYYALDIPDHRKRHIDSISQIGGLLFSSIFLLASSYLEIIPLWFLFGGIISVLLGLLDDNYTINWKLKLVVQLLIVAFLSYTFWGQFDQISFYGYAFKVSQFELLIIFTIWFVGIYNAVNLIDGLDGLAGGFVVLFCSALALINGTNSQINFLLIILIVAFLIFNQRPAKIFMGDAGSLFLGFFVAVTPLLYNDMRISTSSIEMTPFIFLVSFLIADTARVFFTRLLSGRNPMTADTIHFHHLILQNSGSYLATIFMIFMINMIFGLFGVLSNYYDLQKVVMLIHLALLFLFILTPPAPTYVNLITKLVSPIYSWQRYKVKKESLWQYSLLINILLVFLILLMLYTANPMKIFTWQLPLAIILLCIFIYTYRRNYRLISTIQVFIYLFILESNWNTSLGIFSQLLVLMLIIAMFVFTAKRISGTAINQYSTLDIMVFIITLGVVILSATGVPINIWLFLSLFANWFGIGFILRSINYFKPVSS